MNVLPYFLSFWGGLWVINGLNFHTMKIDFLLNYSFLFLWFISIFVTFLLLNLILSSFLTKNYSEFPILELCWTVFPSLILILVATPSLELLYIVESKKTQDLTVKVTGNQWYWNYDYFNIINFDSYMENSNLFSPRLLDTDNHVILPSGKIMAVVTSQDVLHSWSLPALGVKIDANPGRLNSILFSMFLPGVYYGQCSEICGANHSFMPIVLESVNFLLFKQWFLNFK